MNKRTRRATYLLLRVTPYIRFGDRHISFAPQAAQFIRGNQRQRRKIAKMILQHSIVVMTEYLNELILENKGHTHD